MKEKVKKPIYKRPWFIVVCVLVVIGAIGNSDNDKPSAQVNATSVSASVKSESQPSESKPAVSSSITTGQRNALASAKQYLSFSAFSYDGLIKQLQFEEYSNEDSVYAADNCGADWNEQAVKSAKSYLDFSSFSRDGLIKQLEYDGFTKDQAVYGVEKNGY